MPFFFPSVRSRSVRPAALVIFCLLTVLLLLCGGAVLPASTFFLVAEARALAPQVESMTSNGIAVLAASSSDLGAASSSSSFEEDEDLLFLREEEFYSHRGRVHPKSRFATSSSLAGVAKKDEAKETLLCTRDEENRSFWLRNSCYGGFVTVLQQRRAVAQHGGGIGQHSKEGEEKKKLRLW